MFNEAVKTVLEHCHRNASLRSELHMSAEVHARCRSSRSKRAFPVRERRPTKSSAPSMLSSSIASRHFLLSGTRQPRSCSQKVGVDHLSGDRTSSRNFRSHGIVFRAPAPLPQSGGRGCRKTHRSRGWLADLRKESPHLVLAKLTSGVAVGFEKSGDGSPPSTLRQWR